MLRYATTRLAVGSLLAVAVSAVTFLLLQASSGQVARRLLGEGATAEQIALKEAQLGLDEPLLGRFGHWALTALTGDFGVSWFTNEPVAAAVAARVPVTLSMVLPAIVVTALVGVGLGVAAATLRGSVDRAVQVCGTVSFSLPSYWVALVLVVWFSLTLPLLPATGYVPLTESPLAWATSLVLPTAALVIGSVGMVAYQARGAMLDTLAQEHIRTLRSRGASPARIIWVHALRGAAPPVIAVLSLQFVSLLSGAVVIEKVFALPGLGTLTVTAAQSGDVPVIMGVVVTVVAMVVVVNLAIDLVQAVINPKVRLR